MNVIIEATRAICHSGVTSKKPRPIGTDKIKGVNSDNWDGDRFLALNMWITKLQLKLIAYPFYRSDAINTQLLPDLTDVNVNSSVANNHIITPNLA